MLVARSSLGGGGGTSVWTVAAFALTAGACVLAAVVAFLARRSTRG